MLLKIVWQLAPKFHNGLSQSTNHLLLSLGGEFIHIAISLARLCLRRRRALLSAPLEAQQARQGPSAAALAKNSSPIIVASRHIRRIKSPLVIGL
jgi:hypothetical protein